MDGVYCQCCLTINPLGRELCARCNTRLMLVVETPATRFESRAAETALPEEAALERISGVENKIGRILDQMERVLDLMFKQTNSVYENRVAFEALVSLLAENGLIDAEKFAERCREFAARGEARERKKIAERTQDAPTGNESLRARLIEDYRGESLESFAKLIDAAFDAFAASAPARAVKSLERAAALAPDNEPLNFFLGAYFFQESKMALARDYLARAQAGGEVEEARWRIEILLGIARGDEGEVEDAEKLLRASLKRGSTFAARFALGRLAAFAGNWKEAFSSFRHALAARQCVEADYTVGLAALHLKRPRLALRHLQSATEADGSFARAFHLLGFAHLLLKQRTRAAHAWRRAVELSANSAEKASFQETLKATMMPDQKIEIPSAREAFGMTEREKTERKSKRRGLLTGGDERFARLLIDGALEMAASAR